MFGVHTTHANALGVYYPETSRELSVLDSNGLRNLFLSLT